MIASSTPSPAATYIPSTPRHPFAASARADQSGDLRGSAVGEEDAHGHQGVEGGARGAQAGELRGPEVADDRALGEHEQRLGEQRAERGYRQGEDLTARDVRGVEFLEVLDALGVARAAGGLGAHAKDYVRGHTP